MRGSGKQYLFLQMKDLKEEDLEQSPQRTQNTKYLMIIFLNIHIFPPMHGSFNILYISFIAASPGLGKSEAASVPVVVQREAHQKCSSGARSGLKNLYKSRNLHYITLFTPHLLGQ